MDYHSDCLRCEMEHGWRDRLLIARVRFCCGEEHEKIISIYRRLIYAGYLASIFNTIVRYSAFPLWSKCV